ncbi:MAG: VOC family protein [Gammaproteobacteria bacterium]|nr:VOC family protein [Gammaproteobacteria bacterium]
MKINKIDHIGIRVTDFARTKVFYAQLGFEPFREDMNERVVAVSHPCGITLNFLDSADNRYDIKNVLMDIAEKHTGYTHCAFHVDTIEEALKFTKENNIPISEGPVTFGNGKTSLFIRDPDYNVIEFTQDPST